MPRVRIPRGLSSLLTALLVCGCAWPRTPAAEQRALARAVRPAPIGPSFDRAPRWVLRVRAHADQDYRAQRRAWAAGFVEMVDRANAMLVSELGVRLAVVEVRPWERAAPPHDPDAVLADLAATDPGEDVDWVVGLVTAAPPMTTSFRLLGASLPFSRHLFLRAMHDLEEHEAMQRMLGLLPQETRERLYRQRMLHKEVAILLHEWAHTLGAIHVNDEACFMNPSYGPRMQAFSVAAGDLLALSLAYRIVAPGGEPDGPTVRAAVRGFVARTGWAGWDAGERAALLRAPGEVGRAYR